MSIIHSTESEYRPSDPAQLPPPAETHNVLASIPAVVPPNPFVERRARPRPPIEPLLLAPPYFDRKRWFDRALACLLLIPALPVIGLVVLLVRLTSRGPAIYRQTRVGRGGRTFTIYKVRSMTVNAESRTGAVWAAHKDPRVTWLGAILRKTHLDELPQLFNVVKGEMSLVGPRPERPEFVRLLARQIPGYLDRLAAPPGVTGLAQLNLPPDSDVNSVRRKVYLDLQYILHANLWMDLRLILCTAGRMLRLGQPLLLRWLGLRREVPVWACQPRAEAGDLTSESVLNSAP